MAYFINTGRNADRIFAKVVTTFSTILNDNLKHSLQDSLKDCLKDNEPLVLNWQFLIHNINKRGTYESISSGQACH